MPVGSRVTVKTAADCSFVRLQDDCTMIGGQKEGQRRGEEERGRKRKKGGKWKEGTEPTSLARSSTNTRSHKHAAKRTPPAISDLFLLLLRRPAVSHDRSR